MANYEHVESVIGNGTSKNVGAVRGGGNRPGNMGKTVMDLNKMSLFGAVKKRMSWLTQRQEILSQNIANADTPKYKPKDIEAFKFDDMLRSERMLQTNMSRTNAGHLDGNRRRATDFRSQDTHRPWETAPGGNAVVLEEQMAKINETQVSHRVTTELYKKHLQMFKMVVRK